MLEWTGLILGSLMLIAQTVRVWQYSKADTMFQMYIKKPNVLVWWVSLTVVVVSIDQLWF